jgi:hypothetical protein
MHIDENKVFPQNLQPFKSGYFQHSAALRRNDDNIRGWVSTID